jgi:hypothetical protein
VARRVNEAWATKAARDQLLPLFLDTAAESDFDWGTFDCVLWLADWSIEAGAGDPAETYRGTYDSALGAHRIIAAAGGMIPLVGREFERLGWFRAETPAPGDIGVVSVLTTDGQREAGAIFTGAHWAVLAIDGLVFAAFQPLAVWRPPCLRP